MRRKTVPRRKNGLRILFATSEAHPLIKVGGLGDVSAALPAALHKLGVDIRIIMPAFFDARQRAGMPLKTTNLRLPLGDINLLETRLPDSNIPVWLVDHPGYFDHPGNPYAGPAAAWPVNAARFALFAQAIAAVALDQAGLNWRADAVHGNDWQTGLAFPFIARTPNPPRMVFTIHNLAYQGLFPFECFDYLALPQDLRHPGALEFHGQLSFMKGGLNFADCLTTVSPGYANEIQHAEQGYGLDGVLREQRHKLHGILNGIDESIWNPASDTFLAQCYSATDLAPKAANKQALQEELSLAVESGTVLFGLVGRLVHQKGIDLVLDCVEDIVRAGAQLVVLGTGEPGHEHALNKAAARHPSRVAVRIAQNEALAHRIEAGADFFLMPSRFEPCGLNQMYSQRYGTPPIVRRTGGLANTVEHWQTGLVFEHADVEGLRWAIREALELYRRPGEYRRVQLAGMAKDYAWHRAAEAYRSLYQAP